MNLNEFIKTIKEINDNSWGYGNEILYLMGKDITALNDPKKLAERFGLSDGLMLHLLREDLMEIQKTPTTNTSI